MPRLSGGADGIETEMDDPAGAVKCGFDASGIRDETLDLLTDGADE